MSITILISLLTGLLVSPPVSTPKTMLPPAPTPCTMKNGKPRPFPCEFRIVTVWVLGKNNEVVGKFTPASTKVVLPRSKADKINKVGTNGESIFYRLSVDFSRINTPAFPTKAYVASTATVTAPITPSELTDLNQLLTVSPKIPSPFIRPNRFLFPLQLNYDLSGGNPTLIAPVQYLQIKNPITFGKFPSDINLFPDRAEAWTEIQAGVDFKK